MSLSGETGVHTQSVQEELQDQQALSDHLVARIADGYAAAFMSDEGSTADVEAATETFEGAAPVYRETRDRVISLSIEEHSERHMADLRSQLRGERDPSVRRGIVGQLLGSTLVHHSAFPRRVPWPPKPSLDLPSRMQASNIKDILKKYTYEQSYETKHSIPEADKYHNQYEDPSMLRIIKHI